MQVIRKIGRVIYITFCVILILVGIGLFCYPSISNWYLSYQTNKTIEEFENLYDVTNEDLNNGDSEDPTTSEPDSGNTDGEEIVWRQKEGDLLYQTIQEYNTDIYANMQIDLKDAWSYQQSPVDLADLESPNFGYIEIPSMDLKMSLYIGASTKNMAKGAAVLGQTSIPIGGANTNSVIAGHRGYKGMPYFREIEKISVGDYVYITNPWEKLTYRVESIDIVSPYDSQAVKIQEGKDMITLVTCHPYASHGKYRYIVYCVRDTPEITDELTQKIEEDKQEEPKDYIIASDGQVYNKSEADIQKEDFVRKVCGGTIIAMIGLTAIYISVKKKHKEPEHRRFE